MIWTSKPVLTCMIRVSSELSVPEASESRASSVAEGTGGSFDGRGFGMFVGAAAEEKHAESEDEHDESPDEVDVHAGGAEVDVAAARDESVEGEKHTDDEEHEAHGDAEIEGHFYLRGLKPRFFLGVRLWHGLTPCPFKTLPGLKAAL